MYELSRIRLHSVGPKPARYQDITLDLSDIGETVNKPVAALFNTARRPSPASVLFTENGNGKTVLIKLIFSVMLPGRKQIVGTTNTRGLDGLVLANDVAHVVLEWMHPVTGERVVTGKVSAWREHRVSQDPSRLTEAWYSFRPSSTFGLDDLPFFEDGRLVSLVGYRERLTEASAAAPSMQMSWETVQSAWTRKLEDLGLDPELFAYQRRMNAGEGEAAEAFTLKSDEAFVDWLLNSVLDREGPNGLSEVVEKYSERLAERDDVISERDFVAGALERITPLAGAARNLDAARDIRDETHRDATRFAAALAVRRLAEDALLAGMVEEEADLKDEVDASERTVRRLNRITVQLRRITAGMRVDEARQARDALDERVREAQAVLEAWHATPALLQHRQAVEHAAALRSAIRELEAEARGPLLARDRAASRLVRGLVVAAEAVDRAAGEADAAARDHDTQIAAKVAEASEHLLEAARLRGVAQSTTQRVREVQGLIDAAVNEGLIASAEALPEAAEQANADARAAAKEAADGETEAKRLRDERQAANKALAPAIQTANAAHREAENTAQAHRQAADIADALSGEARLATLLGAGDVILDSDAPILRERLGDAIHDAGEDRDQHRDANRKADRILTALGSDGLLPPPEEVTQVREVLQGAGVTCYTGWEYLAQMPEGEHAAVLDAFPHLVDGIVLNNADQAGRARQVLAEARLLPSAAIAVGTTAALASLTGHATDPADTAAGMLFLVEPNPALYDDTLAAQERDRLTAERDQHNAAIAALETQIDADRTLRTRVESWMQTYPPGTLAALEDAATDAADRAARADDAQQAAEARVTAAEDTEADLADRLPALRETAQAQRNLADRLAELTAEHAQVPGWSEEARIARQNSELADQTANAANDEAERLRRAQSDLRRLADDHRRTAAAHREEIGDVPGDTTSDADAPAPIGPLGDLRAVYIAARDAYEKVQVGADLRADLDAREREESRTRQAVEGYAAGVRDTATALLAGPDGGDGPARSGATARARRTVDGLTGDLSTADVTLGGLKRDYEGYQDQETTLDPYGEPDSIEHGEELAARANDDWQATLARQNQTVARLALVKTKIAETGKTAQSFSTMVEFFAQTLSDWSPDEVDTETTTAYAGTADQADSRQREVRGQLRLAQDNLDEADKEVRETTDRLRMYAADTRFEKVVSPVRQQMTGVELGSLHEHADAWEEALKPRLRSLTDELEQIDRHRTQIITMLRGHVEGALRTLHLADRLSELPPTLGDWAGQRFLKIRFTDPDQATLNDRLAEVIEAAVSPDKPTKRDGMTLVLRGVKAALGPRGVKVEMLKPDATLRSEWIGISQVADVFSGGQLLTAAIILYCTMAALRQNDRGRVREPHNGVLFLDNPIGRASAGYLLDLQLGVARALGVQLVYTTGLFDVNALSVFPLIVRMRNDADVRSGMKYLTVEDTITHEFAALGEPDDTGRVTAARLFRRNLPAVDAAFTATREEADTGDEAGTMSGGPGGSVEGAGERVS